MKASLPRALRDIHMKRLRGETRKTRNTKAGRILNFPRKCNNPIEFLVYVDSRRYLCAVWISTILKANYIVNRMLE